MKVAQGFPWNNGDGNKAVQKLVDAGGVYLALSDEWFRGVWTPAPQQVFDADYTRKQQLELSRGGGRQPQLSASGYPLGITAGGGGMEKVGSTVLEGDFEEVEDPDEEDPEENENGEAETEPEEAANRKTAKEKRKAKRR